MSPSVRLKVVGACKPSLTRLTLKGLHSYTQMQKGGGCCGAETEGAELKQNVCNDPEVGARVGHIWEHGHLHPYCSSPLL